MILAQGELENSLSAVMEEDQIVPHYFPVKNWVHSGRPGLFMNGFDKTDNATFHVREAGVYHISANLIIEVTGYHYYYYHNYYSTYNLTGQINLKDEQGKLREKSIFLCVI